MDNRAIGVFDSGIGGVSVLKELQKVLPHENFIYFGDTSRVPYGGRSPQTITKYAMQDIQFLLSKNIKMIIAACGTVSATLTEEVVKDLPVPYCNILLPASKAACAASENGKIGVMATTASIQSGAYGKTMSAIRPDVEVSGKACPLFVPLVENGRICRSDPVTKIIASEYCEAFDDKDIDTLILGCTHYPIISEIIGECIGNQVRLINPGEETAKVTKALLTERDLLTSSEEQGHTEFYVSDNPEGFGEIASLFLGETICGDVQLVDVDKF